MCPVRSVTYVSGRSRLATRCFTTQFRDNFRVADKPLVSPLSKEIAAFLLDCR
jgi:hypothetical protein